MTYVAFLRGINVGGNTIVKMVDLNKILESLGFNNVKTVLASGNAIFDASRTSTTKMRSQIETALEKKYGRKILVILRNLSELEKLDASKPFKGVPVSPQTRLYVTFLSEKPKSISITSAHPGYKILRTTPTEMISVLELSPKVQTPDLMKAIGNALGPKTTMRNWNTVQKIISAAIAE